MKAVAGFTHCNLVPTCNPNSTVKDRTMEASTFASSSAAATSNASEWKKPDYQVLKSSAWEIHHSLEEILHLYESHENESSAGPPSQPVATADTPNAAGPHHVRRTYRRLYRSLQTFRRELSDHAGVEEPGDGLPNFVADDFAAILTRLPLHFGEGTDDEVTTMSSSIMWDAGCLLVDSTLFGHLTIAAIRVILGRIEEANSSDNPSPTPPEVISTWLSVVLANWDPNVSVDATSVSSDELFTWLQTLSTLLSTAEGTLEMTTWDQRCLTDIHYELQTKYRDLVRRLLGYIVVLWKNDPLALSLADWVEKICCDNAMQGDEQEIRAAFLALTETLVRYSNDLVEFTLDAMDGAAIAVSLERENEVLSLSVRDVVKQTDIATHTVKAAVDWAPDHPQSFAASLLLQKMWKSMSEVFVGSVILKDDRVLRAEFSKALCDMAESNAGSFNHEDQTKDDLVDTNVAGMTLLRLIEYPHLLPSSSAFLKVLDTEIRIRDNAEIKRIVQLCVLTLNSQYQWVAGSQELLHSLVEMLSRENGHLSKPSDDPWDEYTKRHLAVHYSKP